jgi:hypothetical protein
MLLLQLLYMTMARVEVGVAKAGVAAVKAEVEAARAKVVVEPNFLILPAPPCHQRPPLQAENLLLLPQELTTS